MKKQFPTIIQETAADYDAVYISGGRIGMSIVLNPADLVRVTRAHCADVVRHTAP